MFNPTSLFLRAECPATVVFVAFESEFAPLGGLAAVMRILPRQMAQQGPAVCLLTPLFKHIARSNARRWASLQLTDYVFPVRFNDEFHDVRIWQNVDADGFVTYLLDAEAFFNAPHNPYLNPDSPEQLLNDALFFCAAVPKALATLKLTHDLILALQDWQTASVALTIKDKHVFADVMCVLTLHNPYDCPVDDAALAQISSYYGPGPTILTKMIPFLNAPICTVSENFAAELVEDPLHTEVYAPHLQRLFHIWGVIGVDNGLFSALDFPEAALAAARAGDVQPVLAEKARRRAALCAVLQAYRPPEAWGELADLDTFTGPIFLFFGRDDPRQKGYDVAAAAIRRLPPGQARFVCTPIPGDEGLEGLRFLRELAEDRPGEIKVFPFRVAQGYLELQRGSTYMVMGSLYEPFGAATEGYAAGTPVIARATGGLVQQVVPYPAASLTSSVARLVARFHKPEALPTGFLFREPDLSREELIAGWRAIIECAYAEDPDLNRLTGRAGIPLFESMAQAAAQALQDAIDLYVQNPVGYGQMIAAGCEILGAFSWERAVAKYLDIYTRVRR